MKRSWVKNGQKPKLNKKNLKPTVLKTKINKVRYSSYRLWFLNKIWLCVWPLVTETEVEGLLSLLENGNKAEPN